MSFKVKGTNEDMPFTLGQLWAAKENAAQEEALELSRKKALEIDSDKFEAALVRLGHSPKDIADYYRLTKLPRGKVKIQV